MLQFFYTRLMTHVLDPFIHKFVIVYLDDIYIYSKSQEEHLDHILQVLTALRKNKLSIKKVRCFWAKRETEYLGFSVGNGKLVTSEHPLRNLQQLKIGIYPKHRSILSLLWLSARFIGIFFTILRIGRLH